MSSAKLKQLLQVVETDLARIVRPVRTYVLSRVNEVDVVASFTVERTYPLTRIDELDVALGLSLIGGTSILGFKFDLIARDRDLDLAARDRDVDVILRVRDFIHPNRKS